MMNITGFISVEHEPGDPRIPIGTLRDWEQCRNRLDAPAHACLTVIARNPEAVAGFLSEAA